MDNDMYDNTKAIKLVVGILRIDALNLLKQVMKYYCFILAILLTRLSKEGDRIYFLQSNRFSMEIMEI